VVPDEVDCTVNETLAVFVFTLYLFYVLSHTPTELLDMKLLTWFLVLINAAMQWLKPHNHFFETDAMQKMAHCF